MTVADDFQTAMQDDTGAGGVNTLLTGDIYTFNDTKKLGLNRDVTPDAFDDTSRKLKPCALVRARAEVPDGGITDDTDQDTSWRQTVVVFLYNDGNTSSATLETVARRLYVLFHGQRVSNRLVRWRQTALDEREEPLDNANRVRVNFQVFGLH